MASSTLWAALALGAAIAGISVIGRRTRVAAPIMLFAAGAAVSFIPGVRALEMQPNLILLVLLPPLLYTSGVNMSWRGFRQNLRPILLLAVGCVVFTAAAVAAAVHFALGLPWAVGFVLGAVVSPPDAVAPMAIARRLGLPDRLLVILEGESLVNDATALVLLSFSLAAVASGTFSPGAAAMRFGVIVGAEIAFGLAVAAAMLWLRHLSNDSRAEVLLALATPFIAFWPPHELGGSGVVACVAAGLYVSWNGPDYIRPATRLQGFFIWDLLAWSVESLIFLLTGLQARAVYAGIEASPGRALLAAALVCATVIIVRFIWVFPATYIPHWLVASIRKSEPFPGWQAPFLIGFTGLRGAVSLAAALSIPTVIDASPFPDRDLLLLVTFAVILVTLVGQGALLPTVIRAMALDRFARIEAAESKREERAARIAGVEAALAAIGQHPDAAAEAAVEEEIRRLHAERLLDFSTSADDSDDDPVTDKVVMQLRLIAVERATIARLFREDKLRDGARRRVERELDLEEAQLRHLLTSVGGRE